MKKVLARRRKTAGRGGNQPRCAKTATASKRRRANDFMVWVGWKSASRGRQNRLLWGG